MIDLEGLSLNMRMEPLCRIAESPDSRIVGADRVSVTVGAGVVNVNVEGVNILNVHCLRGHVSISFECGQSPR